MSYITKLLDSLDNIKVYHWQTKTYARHKATDDLYAGLAKLIDTFVETHIGEQGGERPVFAEGDVYRIRNWNDKTAEEFLRNFAKWLSIDLQAVVGESIALHHLLEEMLTLVNQTLYLFTFA